MPTLARVNVASAQARRYLRLSAGRWARRHRRYDLSIPTMTRPVILTVDDDPQVLAAIASDLRKRYSKDYRIVRAASAAEALDALRGLKEAAEPVALLLSDQRMPGLDGVGFLARGQGAVSGRQARAADGLRRHRRGHRRHQPVAGGLLPAEALGPARASSSIPIVDDLLDDWRAQYRPGYGGVKVIGSRYMPTVHQIKDFLARNHVPYKFFDVEATDERGAECACAGRGRDAAAGDAARTASGCRRRPLADLAQKVGLSVEAKGDDLRRRHRRRRPGRAGRRGVCGVGRAEDDPDRSRRAGRAGGLLEPHRELPGISRRASRDRTWRGAP